MATCIDRSHPRSTTYGFTLIEMMAVLVLMGLLAAVVLPNFDRWFTSTQQKVSTSEVIMQLQKLYARTALMGLDFVLDAQSAATPLPDGQPALALPPEWSLPPGQRLAIYASGLCTAADITFKASARTLTLDIHPDNCNISIRTEENP